MPSDKIKRQRKRKRVDSDGDPEFQVAPMVDVLLVLMLFFMSITSTELLKKDKNIVLPDAANGKKPDKQMHKIIVNVGWSKQDQQAELSLEGQPFATATDMSGALAARHKADAAAFVLIRADKDVEYSNIADVMTACASAGIGTVTFAVTTGGGKNKPAGDAAPAAPQ
jgi:biopolymer transport protein ExbD